MPSDSVSGEVPSLAELVRAGGVFGGVEAATARDALRAIVQRLRFVQDEHRHDLLAALEAREALGSTGIGGGIAIPHVQNPALLELERPSLAVFLLERDVDFGAPDGVPVHALFVVLSPNASVHVRILARLGVALRDATLRDLLRVRARREEIVRRIEHVEQGRITGAARTVTRD